MEYIVAVPAVLSLMHVYEIDVISVTIKACVLKCFAGVHLPAAEAGK